MTMTHQYKKSPTSKAEKHMAQQLGTKIVVIGGANARKVGYIVGQTACQYRIVFVDGSAGDVWRQNVRELTAETTSTDHSGGSEAVSAEERAEIERRLNRALLKLRDVTNEIDALVHRLAGGKLPQARAFAEGKRSP